MKASWNSLDRAPNVILLVSITLLGAMNPAAAVRRTVDLGTPVVVGRLNDEAFLRIDLPLDSLEAWDVEAEEALLVVKSVWPMTPQCISVFPVGAGAAIPDGNWTAEGSWESFWDRLCPVSRGAASGYYCASVKMLVNEIHDATCSATALVIGTPVGSGACGRFAAELIEELEGSPSTWSARLDFFDATIIEEEQ